MEKRQPLQQMLLGKVVICLQGQLQTLKKGTEEDYRKWKAIHAHGLAEST
jgi:hypothetical protein